MDSKAFQQMLSVLAQKYDLTPQQIYRSMEIAIESAQSSSDPAIQKKWSSIPHKGKTVTPEDLISYIIGSL
ncbi:MAG: hypothetical protein E7437_01350 [Ruminococcaceae bacterium]|nr:hypothetical protein [Oscillospiraceae bacterium]